MIDTNDLAFLIITWHFVFAAALLAYNIDLSLLYAKGQVRNPCVYCDIACTYSLLLKNSLPACFKISALHFNACKNNKCQKHYDTHNNHISKIYYYCYCKCTSFSDSVSNKSLSLSSSSISSTKSVLCALSLLSSLCSLSVTFHESSVRSFDFMFALEKISSEFSSTLIQELSRSLVSSSMTSSFDWSFCDLLLTSSIVQSDTSNINKRHKLTEVNRRIDVCKYVN